MRLALFASGGGSNAGAIFDAIENGTLDAEPALLVADRPCRALGRAETRDVPTAVLSPDDYADDGAFGEALLAELGRAEIDAVVLAGYLRKLPASVVWAFQHRVLNVHPSLLPAFGGPGFYGLRVHQAVLERGCTLSGATVHLVDAQYDAGPIVLQEAVEVFFDDSPETLAARVLAVEHELLPRALQLLATDKLHVVGGRVQIL